MVINSLNHKMKEHAENVSSICIIYSAKLIQLLKEPQ